MFGREIDDSMNLSLHPELIQDVMQTLMNKNVIGDKALNYLKQDDIKTYEPAMIMDLRHDQIRQEHKESQKKRQILEEARRVIQNEEKAEKEKVKELRLVNREIQKFQKQLEMEHKKLINEYSLRRVSEKKLWTVIKDKNTPPMLAVTAMREKMCNLQDMKNSNLGHDEFLDVKTLQIEEIHHKEFDCEDGNRNFIEVSIRKVENRDNLQQNVSAVSENGKTEKSEPVFNSNFKTHEAEKEYEIMNTVWIKWMKFVQRKKIISPKKLSMYVNEESKTENQVIRYVELEEEIKLDRKSVSQTIGDDVKSECDEDCDNYTNEYYFEQVQRQKNKTVLKKYFKKWRGWVLEKRELRHLKAEKQRREEKIQKYIELIGSKKKSAFEAKSKSNSSLEESSTAGASDFSDSYSKISKTSSKSAGYGEKYKCRFEAQKNIIAQQKSKLEDQNKLIEDLKSFQLKLEAEMWQRESSKNLKATLENFDPRLKSKAAFVQRALSSDSGYKSFERASDEGTEGQEQPGEHSPSRGKSVSLEIVRRMERRNEERKQKSLAAQERRRQLEEEKLLKIKHEEEMRQKRELEAKQRKFEELRERQRQEKQREEERIREREIFQQNCQIADESNRRRLLAKGLRRLRLNVLVTKRDTFIAGDHYKTKVRQRCFRRWRRNVQQTVAMRVNEAVQFYNRRLIEKAFRRFLDIYRDYIQKQQAADDMYDMKVQSKCFNKWYDITCMGYLEMQEKMKIAANFHNRRIVRCHFNQWKKLPKIMFEERSREQRLRALRERVRELLPDYHPVPFDDED